MSTANAIKHKTHQYCSMPNLIVCPVVSRADGVTEGCFFILDEKSVRGCCARRSEKSCEFYSAQEGGGGVRCFLLKMLARLFT